MTRRKSEGKDGEPDEGRFPRDKVFEAPNWEGRQASGEAGLGDEKVKCATCMRLLEAAFQTGD